MKHLILISLILTNPIVNGSVQILSKSKLKRCEQDNIGASLNCTKKIVLDMAIPSESSGGEASIVAEVDEVQENSTDSTIRTIRNPPMITITKSAVYAEYHLTYIRDVAYRPEEYDVQTRKCDSNAGANVVGRCEKLRDNQGRVIEHTQPTCCPCGKWRRVPSSCGNFFDKMRKGKRNTAHCVRFPGDWFHVFGIGQHQVGFSIRVGVKRGSETSEVIIGPNNRAAASDDNFLRVSLIGDYYGYTEMPSFEDFFLVIPRQGGPGQPKHLGNDFSKWMLLERVRFTLDGLECNKIGVSYEAFNGQPDFCSSPRMSCLHNQLWNFWEADQNRINRNQEPLYDVQGRYERINQHPNAGSQSFSIGVTGGLTSNLLVELSADDIEFVYQKSPGSIVSIAVPTFQALTQCGTATIATTNTGGLEASYSLTFDCSAGVNKLEEQFFIMKPKEVVSRFFKLYPTNDQAAKYVCHAILKDSDFHEIDRAECQFTTTATVLDNGTQTPYQQPKDGGVKGFFESIEDWWHAFWEGMVDFISGRSCRTKCSSFFDLHCHIHYICMSWLLMFGLFLAIFPTVILLLWLLHENGLFDPIYDWWEDHFWDDEQKIRHMRKHHHGLDANRHYNKHHKKKPKHHHTDGHHKRQRGIDQEHKHNHPDKHKHGRVKGSSNMHPLYGDGTTKGMTKHGHATSDDTHHKHLRSIRRG